MVKASCSTSSWLGRPSETIGSTGRERRQLAWEYARLEAVASRARPFCEGAAWGAVVRDRRQRRGVGLAPGLHRPDAEGSRRRSCSRVRRGSASRRSGSPESSRRARAACASSRRGRPRPSVGSRTRRWATCSRASSTRCCPRSRRRRRRALEIALLLEEAASDPVDPRALGIATRDALAAARRSRPAARRDRRRAVARRVVGGRARVRAATARRDPCSCCSPGASSTGTQPSAIEQALGASASSGSRWGRSASARSTGSCATGSAGRSRGRRCCASTSDRAATRSSRSSWRACSDRTSTRSSRSPCPRRSTSSLRARLTGLPEPTRDALGARRGAGHDSEALLERAGVRADALDPASRRT